MKHICVIGDVVQSRSIRDRAGLQKQLQKSLSAMNRRRRRELASPWTITLGDEFQAVYRESGSLFSDSFGLLHDVYPIRVRFSVGIDVLTTSLNRKTAIGMDGPAFYAARAALEDLKRSHSLFRIGGDATPRWINLVLDLISHESSSWRKNRLLVFTKLMDGSDVKAIAGDIQVTTAAVYKNIGSGALLTMRALLEEIAEWADARRGSGTG